MTPMTNYTPKEHCPGENVLNYIRCFARLYNPEANNEREARMMASLLSCDKKSMC